MYVVLLDFQLDFINVEIVSLEVDINEEDPSKMLQTPHDDEVYFNITSLKVPSNDAGKAHDKATTGSSKEDMAQKKKELSIERLKSPAEAADETTFFDVSAEAAAADTSPKPEKNVSTPEPVCAPEDSCIPSEIDDDTHEIDVSHFDVMIGGKNDHTSWVLHRKMPVKAICFPWNSHEKDVRKEAQNFIDSTVSMAQIVADTDSQVFFGEGIFKRRALDSEGIPRGNQINESGNIHIIQNASGASRGAKDASSIDKRKIPLERAAIESVQRAMNESHFTSPDNENPENRPQPIRSINTVPSDTPPGIRDRVDKAYSALLNKNDAVRNLNDMDPPKSNKGVSLTNKKTGALPSFKRLNSKTVSLNAVFGIETTVFKASVIETSADPNYIVFALHGRFDQDQKQLEGFLEQIITLGFQTLICDMSGLTSMSSSGWGILIAQLQRLRKHGGNMCLCGMNGEVEQCFRVLELDKLFSFYRSISEAVSTIRQATPNTTTTASDTPDIASLTLEEKIRRIIAGNPYGSVGGIHKQLGTDEFGKVKISGWSLQAKLVSMGLGTKEERYRFFRSA